MHILNKMFHNNFFKWFFFSNYSILKFLNFWNFEKSLIINICCNISYRTYLCVNTTLITLFGLYTWITESRSTASDIYEKMTLLFYLQKCLRYIKWDLNLLVYSDKLSNNSFMFIWTEKLKQFFINPTNLCYN